MTFSYSAIWDDTVAMLRQHGRLLAAVAGVFIFLPAALMGVLFPDPEPVAPDQILAQIIEYYGANWHWLTLSALLAMVGGAAMLRLALARRTSVGEAIGYAAVLLPFYFLLSLLTSIIVGLGLLALIVPGLYLVGRLTPATAVLVAEDRRNPIEAIRRSFEITRGRGWAVFGIVAIVTIVGGITTGVAGMIVGIVFHLAAGQELGAALTAILVAALNSAFSVVLLMLGAAIYRALVPGERAGAVFE